MAPKIPKKQKNKNLPGQCSTNRLGDFVVGEIYKPHSKKLVNMNPANNSIWVRKKYPDICHVGWGIDCEHPFFIIELGVTDTYKVFCRAIVFSSPPSVEYIILHPGLYVPFFDDIGGTPPPSSSSEDHATT